MRILLVKELCPICKVMQETINRFNTRVNHEDHVGIMFVEKEDSQVNKIIEDVSSKEEKKRGLSTPLLLFDGFILKREKITHGISDPIEMESMLIYWHEAGRYNLKNKYEGMYF